MLVAIESNLLYEDKVFSDLKKDDGLKIVDSEFLDCTFKNCKFFQISFFDCTFENCVFENCDLASAFIQYTSFSDVKFIDSKLTGIQWAAA